MKLLPPSVCPLRFVRKVIHENYSIPLAPTRVSAFKPCLLDAYVCESLNAIKNNIIFLVVKILLDEKYEL